MTLIVYIVLGCLTALVIWLFVKQFGKEFTDALIISLVCELIIIVIGLFLKFGKKIFTNLSNLRPYYYSNKFSDEEIRLSFAYLIRIKVNNRYLLVKGGHGRNLYGPVGGVYHIEHTDYVYSSLGFSRDETPGDSKDVRGTIKGKNIKKFIKWFDKKENREINPNREYCEELINSSILPDDLFGNPTFKFLKTEYKGISYGEHYKKNELLRFDIFEYLLNEKQIEYLMNNINNSRKIKLFTKEEIRAGGVTTNNDNRIVGTQTPYILED